MKNIAILFVLATAIGCNNAASNDAVKTNNKDSLVTVRPVNAPPADAIGREKWMKAVLKPGDMHKMLASTVGVWNAERTFWMNESAQPQKDTGTCENKMILGCYLQSIFVFNVSRTDTPYMAINTLGYDNIKRIFESTWLENGSTSMLYFEGTMDSVTKTITLKGHYEDWSGRTEMKRVVKLIDDKHEVIEFYGTHPAGKEMKFTEIVLTRK